MLPCTCFDAYVWAMNVPGYRSCSAALCCGLIHQHRCGHPLPIVVTYALVVAEPCAWAGARRVARCNSLNARGAADSDRTDPPASVWTSVANCCYLRAGCCRTVCMGWCKTSGEVQLVECTRRCRFRSD